MNKKERSSFVISRRILVYALLHVFFDVLFAIWVVLNMQIPIGDPYEKVIFPWVILFICIDLIGFLIARVDFAHIGLWFAGLSFAFMFGNVLLEALGLDTSLTWDPSVYYSNQEKFISSAYALMCINALSLGSILVTKRGDADGLLLPEEDDLQRKTGIVCLAIGFPTSLFQSLQVVLATQASGSYETYATANTSVIIDDLSYLFVVGVILLVVSKAVRRSRSLILVTCSCFYFVLMMVLSGSRKFALFGVIAIVLCYLWVYRSERFPPRKTIMVIIAGILLLNLLYVIREYRTDLASILPHYIDSLLSFNFFNLLGEVFAETGLTFYSVVGIMAIVPSIFPFEMGATFFRSLFSFLPIGWLVGDFFTKAASTQVINTYTGIPVGASLFGDFYWNWGFAGGVVASLTFGIVLGMVFNRLIIRKPNPALYFSILYIVLVGVRAGVVEIFRPLVMVTLLPYLISELIKSRSSRVKDLA